MYFKTRVFGFFLLRYNEYGMTVSRLNVAYYLVLWSLLISEFAMGILATPRATIRWRGPTFLHFVYSIQKAVDSIMPLLACISLIIKRRAVFAFIRKLKTFDYQLASVGVVMRISKRPKYAVLPVLLVLFLTVLPMTETSRFHRFWMYRIQGALSKVCCNFFILGATSFVSESVEEILRRIRTIVFLTKKAGTRNPLTYKVLLKLSVLGKCSEHLCEAADIINGVLSWQIWYALISSFTRAILSIFSLKRLLWGPRLFGPLGTCCSIALDFYVIYHIITSMILLCSRTTNEFAKHKSYLYKKILENNIPASHQKEQLELHLNSIRTVVFACNGVFKLGRPLLHGIAAAVASYLVVLYQLDLQPAKRDQHLPAENGTEYSRYNDSAI